jgi:hypothetical protein
MLVCQRPLSQEEEESINMVKIKFKLASINIKLEYTLNFAISKIYKK